MTLFLSDTNLYRIHDHVTIKFFFEQYVFSNDRLSTLVDHIITRTFRSSPNQSLAMHQRANNVNTLNGSRREINPPDRCSVIEIKRSWNVQLCVLRFTSYFFLPGQIDNTDIFVKEEDMTGTYKIFIILFPLLIAIRHSNNLIVSIFFHLIFPYI